MSDYRDVPYRPSTNCPFWTRHEYGKRCEHCGWNSKAAEGDSLAHVIEVCEQHLERQLRHDEYALVARMHQAGKTTSYIVNTMDVPPPEEADDDELITTMYEYTLSGPQDITHLSP